MGILLPVLLTVARVSFLPSMHIDNIVITRLFGPGFGRVCVYSSMLIKLYKVVVLLNLIYTSLAILLAFMSYLQHTLFPFRA